MTGREAARAFCKIPDGTWVHRCKSSFVMAIAVLYAWQRGLQQIVVNKVKFAITQENRRYSDVLPISWPRYICKVHLLDAC